MWASNFFLLVLLLTVETVVHTIVVDVEVVLVVAVRVLVGGVSEHVLETRVLAVAAAIVKVLVKERVGLVVVITEVHGRYVLIVHLVVLKEEVVLLRVMTGVKVAALNRVVAIVTTIVLEHVVVVALEAAAVAVARIVEIVLEHVNPIVLVPPIQAEL